MVDHRDMVNLKCLYGGHFLKFFSLAPQFLQGGELGMVARFIHCRKATANLHLVEPSAQRGKSKFLKIRLFALHLKMGNL